VLRFHHNNDSDTLGLNVIIAADNKKRFGHYCSSVTKFYIAPYWSCKICQ